MRVIDVIVAMARQEGQSKGGAGNWSWLVMIALMFGILWFLMIRPQRQREAKRREMLNQVKKSDHVVTVGGIHGVVTQIRGDDLVLKVDEAANVKITVTKSAVARVIDKSAEGGEAAAS
jgi:preprotein translocase subunit YajC